jgi:Tfp pilus assembly protein PilF
MKKIFIHIIYLSFIFITACHQSPVTHLSDYAQYLQPGNRNAGLQFIDEELSFWSSRLQQMPGDIISSSKIAGLLTRRFSYSGDIREIKKADSLYQLVNKLNRINSSSTYRSLAANCITQHQFMQAEKYIDSALRLGDDKYLTVLMEFDVAMELGEYSRARMALNSLADKKSFEYLIRKAKYEDHAEGDLDGAIRTMEQAYEKEKNTSALFLWTRSNLGDMYGHANRFRESYQCYLDVLKRDPNYYHALKGIAWLAFSHDKDIAQSRQILNYLKQKHPVPDYELMLADIATYEQDEQSKQQHLEKYVELTQNVLYGGMYNKYSFQLESGELDNARKSLEIAQQEVHNRPTPESYSWLAYAYCKNGEVFKATEIARIYVENKCFEPDSKYYLGLIYQRAGNNNKARKYLLAAKESSYELGPVIARQIDQLLGNL